MPGHRVGVGAYSNFVDLNRRESVAGADFVAHATNSITHDATDQAVMQTHESLAAIFASARAIAGSADYRVGPVAIPARRTGRFAPSAGTRSAGASDDPRQHGHFAAAWLVGYAAEAARAGIDAVTFGSLTGPAGAVDDDGKPRPIFHVLRLLFAASAQPAVSLTFAADDLRGLAWVDGGNVSMLIANQTPRPQQLASPGLIALAILDAGSKGGFAEVDAKAGKIELDGYAVAHGLALQR
ncbi:hypothetical protein BH10PSE9_BH10PSE9_25750 [soil metagenome]